MVSVGVSKMGKMRLVFVEPGAKINSEYYCNHLLERSLLPDIRDKCGRHNWILQQDGAPSHSAYSESGLDVSPWPQKRDVGGTPLSTEWFSHIPTKAGLPSVRCPLWRKVVDT